MNDGDPNCPICYGKGESQGRGQTHPCSCLHWRVRDLKARVAELEALVVLVRKRCREAVPQWAPELREALARLDASSTGEGEK